MKDGWTENLTVEVLIDGKLVGSATYGHKKEIAQNRAAKAALDKLKETLGDMSLSAPSPDWNVLWPILSKIVSAQYPHLCCFWVSIVTLEEEM